MLKLTLYGTTNNDVCYVRPSVIDAVYSVSEGPVVYTVVVIAGSSPLRVQESAEDIVAMLEPLK